MLIKEKEVLTESVHGGYLQLLEVHWEEKFKNF
jgi:hypothetical protein